jgi:transposase
VPKATLIEGFATLAPFFSPLYEALVEISRQQRHWHLDETRWQVFAEREGKASHRWWLWVLASKLVVCYVLDPSRSKAVPEEHLGEDATGIISVDRYSADKSLAQTLAIILAFCWSHTRRDFDRLVERYQNHRDKKYIADWANQWLDRIANRYRLNDARVEVIDEPEKFDPHHQQLLSALAEIKAEAEKDYPHWEQKKVMASRRNHWEGYARRD